MFQSFDARTRPEDGPPRLAALRRAMARAGLDGFLVPRGDRFRGEYVAPRDERLAWLTGFTGSAGFAAVLSETAGLFVDGRYRLQARAQIDGRAFTPVDLPETGLEDWLVARLPGGGTVGFDPWLHSASEIADLDEALAPKRIALRAVENPIDDLWRDQPSAPVAPAVPWPLEYAGRDAAGKLSLVVADLADDAQDAAVLTQPDSLCWLLNLRGGDVAHTPLLHAMAILHADGRLDLFVEAEKLAGVALPDPVAIHPPAAFETRLRALGGTVRLDPATAPHAVRRALDDGAATPVEGQDPCLMPKARKHPAEIAATRGAHIRDGTAVARFLHWFDRHASAGGLTEIDCVRALEGFRRATGALREISFDTIAGAGPNGAIIHYRVTDATNAPILPGQLFLIDSGAQYEDGTTDITRTLPAGAVGAEERTAFTQVLRGMIAIHRARFPKGITGAHLDALARAPLWAAGRDFDHGAGHGVGVYLSVHEGPQRLGQASTTPLEPGMILSNEPGYYRDGAFGIRLENLVVVTEAPRLAGGDDRDMLAFETLSFAPVHRRLIDPEMLSRDERAWIDAYHAEVASRIGPLLDGETAHWLEAACAPL